MRGAIAIVMGGIHWDRCKTLSISSAPFSPPPNLPPYIIYTPEAAPEVPSKPVNDLNRWLVIYGSVFLGLSCLQLLVLCIFEYGSKTPRVLGMLFLIACSLAWIIYGGIILFGKQGKTCKNSIDKRGYRVYQTTLAMWILMIIGFPGLISTTCWEAFE